MKIYVNARALLSQVTGVQRYILEILNHAEFVPIQISSSHAASGVKGHLWEQFWLPLKVRSGLLWSPSNSGPLLVKNQVLTLHDMASLENPERLSKLFALWCAFLIPRLVLRVRRVIVTSEFTKQRLVANTKVEAKKIHVIPAGVDQRFHPRSQDIITAALAPMELPSNLYLLSVGSLEPRKNLHRLLAAWRIAQTNLPDDIWLVLAGGRAKSTVFGNPTIADEIPPRVHMTGYVDDALLPALYAGATAFVYVSEYEGFGLPPLEAMASGVPVIVSKNTSIPEVVGNAGVYVDPFIIEDIAAGLLRVLQDNELAQELGALGLERAKLFTWVRTAEMTMQVLREAAAETA